MSGLVQRVVVISEEQNEFLQRRSREIGITEDELVQRAIEAISSVSEQRTARRDAWQRLRLAMEERAQMNIPQTGRTWSRDDLYDAEHRF